LNSGQEEKGSVWLQKLKKLQFKEVGLFFILAIFLLLAAWRVFGGSAEKTTVSMNATEQKLALILENIDGVGVAEVMVSETESGEKGAVIVCEGANDIRVLIAVREAVATALGTAQKNVKIYLKKD
jgi:hypothetical protein